MVIFDNVRDEMTVVTPVRPDGKTDAKKAYKAAEKRLKSVIDSLDSPLPHTTANAGRRLAAPEPRSNTTPAQYLDMVARAKEYIAAGDIFQVVLSQRFSAPFTLPPIALYRSLRRLNPSPFLFHLDFGAFALVGSSPEILVRVRDGEVTIRPIAGTRRRGADDAEDRALEADLLADPKERAEHLMLLDLGRNDVGRVAKIGTVEVTTQFIDRALQPRHAHRLERRGNARRQGARCRRRADGRLPGRNGFRRSEGARDGNHRRIGEVEARAVRAAASAISPPAARWIPASCCVPLSSRTA